MRNAAPSRWMSLLLVPAFLIPPASAASKAPVRGAHAIVVTTEPRATQVGIGVLKRGVREGMIDSKEDVDLLLLAMELDALLVTADQGLIKWAEKLGIKWLFPEKFKDYLLVAIKRSGLLTGKCKLK